MRDLLRSQPIGMTVAATNQLEWLARLYGGVDKLGHEYLPHYARHLGPLRMRVNTVLEIGIGSPDGYDAPTPGGSLRMWRDYFPRSTVAALDITPKRVDYGPRVKTYRADQSSELDLLAVADDLGPLDIVIDDGSHVGAHQLTSFRTLFPRVRPGGWYVIEDVSTSYYPSHDGDIPAPEISGVGLARQLVDAVQVNDPTFRNYPQWGPAPSTEHPGVAQMTVYPGIFFVRKCGGAPRRSSFRRRR